MKRYIAISLLLVLSYNASQAQFKGAEERELPVSGQPSPLVNVRLVCDRYYLLTGQGFATIITNHANQKVRIKGTVSALTFCGTKVSSNFDMILDPGGKTNSTWESMDGSRSAVTKDNCGESQPTTNVDNPKIAEHNYIRSVSLENFNAVVYKDNDQTQSGSQQNTQVNSYGSSSQNGSSYHTAMNANDPRGDGVNSASQQEGQRQEQLNILNQKLNYQAQKYNNVADAVKSLTNLLIGSMTQHFINEDIKGRNERFAELQNKVNSKPGTLVDCSECNGKGYFTCTDCNGNGYKGDGDERTICAKCNGLGKTQCVHCRGTGEEFKEDFEAEYGRKSSSDNINNTQQINTQSYNSTSNTEDDPSSSNFSGAGAYGPSEIPKYAAQFASKGQYRAAFNLYRIVTKGGYSAQQEQEADNVIASYYERGKYVAANADSARKYYAQAAALHLPSTIPSNIIAGATQTASGLYYNIEKQGYGSKPVAGQKVTIQYTETLIDGTKIGSSYDNHQAFQFDLGQVIKGLSEGVTLLDIGGKARLIVPPSLGYGSTAIGNIPANSVLIFEIELLNIQ